MRVTCLSGVASLALVAAALIPAAPASADTLREALVQAYNSNPSILAARARLRQGRANDIAIGLPAGWRACADR